MRNFKFLFMAIFLGTSATFATTADDKVAERNAYRYDNSFIFEEQGITFAVYPDGEFDFYIDNRIGRQRRNVTFNSGFDYSPFAQYDDYGAVIQVENVPIYYDFYGRVSNIGRVDIGYRNGRVRRLGNMFVYYNRRGFYDYHTGFINIYNRNYFYRPFHSFFSRPALGFCFVSNRPYRMYYNPFRYTYYRPYSFNNRYRYAQIGNTYRNKKIRRERENVYRNDKRVTLRENSGRSNRTVASRGNGNVVRNNRGRINRGSTVGNTRTNRSTRTTVRSNRATSVDRTKPLRSSGYKKGVVRSENRGRTIKRSTTTIKRAPKRNTVTKRTVTQTPRSRTVTKRTVQRPTNRTSRSTGIAKRSSSSRSRSVGKETNTSRNSVARSTSSRSQRGKAITRSRARL